MSSRILADSAEPPPKKDPPPPEKPVEEPDAAPEPPPPDEAGEPAEPSLEAPEGQPAKEAISPEVQKRLDRLRWEKAESDRRYQALQAQMERDRQQANRPPGDQTREAVRQELMNEQAQLAFNAACNDLFAKGQAEYGEEMQDAVKLLNAVGYGERPDALAAITSLPEGHKVYRQLAQDPDRAALILAMPPMGMMVELARMAANPAAAAPQTTGNSGGVPVTRAPEPVRTIGGNATRAEKPLDQVSMAEFIRRRDKEEKRSRILR